MTTVRLIAITLLGTCIAAACGGEARTDAEATASDSARAAQGAATTERNACRLMTHEEVSALVGRRVTMADQMEAEPGYSKCKWDDSTGTVAFMVSAYWTGGKRQFDIWREARGLGNELFVKTEGVSTDSLVKQGPVRGVGDAAFFSDMFPSLLLKGDTMLELMMNLVPNAEAKFRPLAEQLLARI